VTAVWDRPAETRSPQGAESQCARPCHRATGPSSPAMGEASPSGPACVPRFRRSRPSWWTVAADDHRGGACVALIRAGW